MENAVVQFLKTIFSDPAVRESVNTQVGSCDNVLSAMLSGLSISDSACAPVPDASLPKPKKQKKTKSSAVTDDGNFSDLNKLTIVMLKDRCKSLGLKPVGNKQSLINKIKEHMSTNQNRPEEVQAEDEIEIVKDAQGLYVHPQTGLIFNPNTRVIVAYKDQDGCVLPLTAEHIELCNQYGFEYRIDED